MSHFSGIIQGAKSLTSLPDIACHSISRYLNAQKSGHHWEGGSHLRFPWMPNTWSDCSEPTRHTELPVTSPCFISKSMVVSVLDSYTTLSSPSSSFLRRPGLISSAPFTWLNEPERKLECTRETCGAAKPCLHCLSIVYKSVPAVSVLAASAGMISVIFLGSVWTVKPKIRTEAVKRL